MLLRIAVESFSAWPGSWVFAPAAAGQCVLAEKTVTAPLLTGKAAADGHGDVEVRYVYRCAQPAALNAVQIAEKLVARA